jgi:hypothetical protein
LVFGIFIPILVCFIKIKSGNPVHDRGEDKDVSSNEF